MEAESYYQKTMVENDPLYVFALQFGNRLGRGLGKVLVMVKDYFLNFILKTLVDILPDALRKKISKSSGNPDEKWMNYASSTIATMLVGLVVIEIYMLLLCD